jgi:hypothetical protein
MGLDSTAEQHFLPKAMFIPKRIKGGLEAAGKGVGDGAGTSRLS